MSTRKRNFWRSVAFLLCALILPVSVLSAAHGITSEGQQASLLTPDSSLVASAAKTLRKVVKSPVSALLEPSYLEREREREEETRERTHSVAHPVVLWGSATARRLSSSAAADLPQVFSRIDQICYSEYCTPPPASIVE
jgi:hypothetical protein